MFFPNSVDKTDSAVYVTKIKVNKPMFLKKLCPKVSFSDIQKATNGFFLLKNIAAGKNINIK